MAADHALEMDRVFRHPRPGLQVAVINRQRKIAERDARDVDARADELLRGRRRQLDIERAGADRAGDDEDLHCGHDFNRIAAAVRGRRRTVSPCDTPRRAPAERSSRSAPTLRWTPPAGTSGSAVPPNR